ncbi:hypothetical protein [Burkholderia latens]|uniref:hypothetical protein n=1 Tax=Burkholderia latens TaxID=488446 RepID=UPI001AE3C2A5|nr:hypothetical protein [Burkholderia latens]QTO46379.1 hypothetical protein J8I85_18225 [Burkholderia latens]
MSDDDIKSVMIYVNNYCDMRVHLARVVESDATQDTLERQARRVEVARSQLERRLAEVRS